MWLELLDKLASIALILPIVRAIANRVYKHLKQWQFRPRISLKLEFHQLGEADKKGWYMLTLCLSAGGSSIVDDIEAKIIVEPDFIKRSLIMCYNCPLFRGGMRRSHNKLQGKVLNTRIEERLPRINHGSFYTTSPESRCTCRIAILELTRINDNKIIIRIFSSEGTGPFKPILRMMHDPRDPRSVPSEYGDPYSPAIIPPATPLACLMMDQREDFYFKLKISAGGKDLKEYDLVVSSHGKRSLQDANSGTWPH